MAERDKKQMARVPRKAEILHGVSDSRLIAAYAAAQPWLRRTYVTGIGIGVVWESGKPTQELGLSVHVRKRVPSAQLSERQRFPRTLLGVRVDVVEANIKTHLSQAEVKARRRVTADPLRPGVLIKAADGGLGTVGLLVRSRTNGQPFVLGSGHVLGQAGTTFFQPNPSAANALRMTVLRVERSRGDAGIAAYSGRPADNRPIGFSRLISSDRPVRFGDELTMSGAFSGATIGVVDWVGQRPIPYGGGVTIPIPGFQLRPRKAGQELTQPGDSGALWFDDAGSAVGINVGGEGGVHPWAFASHITDMMSVLGVERQP